MLLRPYVHTGSDVELRAVSIEPDGRIAVDWDKVSELRPSGRSARVVVVVGYAVAMRGGEKREVQRQGNEREISPRRY